MNCPVKQYNCETVIKKDLELSENQGFEGFFLVNPNTNISQLFSILCLQLEPRALLK